MLAVTHSLALITDSTPRYRSYPSSFHVTAPCSRFSTEGRAETARDGSGQRYRLGRSVRDRWILRAKTTASDTGATGERARREYSHIA